MKTTKEVQFLGMILKNLKTILKKYKRSFIYLIYKDKYFQNFWKSTKREIIDHYLKDMRAPHRVWQTSFFKNSSSVLEVGCDWGSNLVLMSQTNPEISKLYGIDISPEAIEIGKKYCLEQGINNLQLMEGNGEDLSFFPDSSIDIVFTNMVLLYIGPNNIQKIIKEFLRVANDSVYLLEFHSEELRGVSENSADGWIYNYKKLLQPIVGSAALSIVKLPDHMHPMGRWDEFAYLVKIKKT